MDMIEKGNMITIGLIRQIQGIQEQNKLILRELLALNKKYASLSQSKNNCGTSKGDVDHDKKK